MPHHLALRGGPDTKVLLIYEHGSLVVAFGEPEPCPGREVRWRVRRELADDAREGGAVAQVVRPQRSPHPVAVADRLEERCGEQREGDGALGRRLWQPGDGA